jgi:hypothetical protein
VSFPILFLDVDGVLNTHIVDPDVMCGQLLSCKVALLNDVLRITNAKLVLSSAWRYLVHRQEMKLRGLEWLLRSHGVLADRLIGITRRDTMERGVYDGKPGTWPVCNERGQQIADWLKMNHRNAIYAVVDDLDLGISDAGHPFVQTDGTVGMTEEDAVKLMELLRRKAVAA